jgi:hypothetical protein
VPVEVGDDAIEVIADEGAPGASRVLLVDPIPEADHEVVDEQLGAAVEEVRQGLGPVLGLEAVVLLDWNPGQLLALPCELVPAPHVLLLSIEQLLAAR